MGLADRLRRFVHDDSMTLALFSLFLVSVAAQSVAGSLAYDASLRQGGFAAVGYGGYLRTGDFWDGVFANWQAALLQLAVLVAFSSVLRQRGAPHSRKEAQSSELNPRTFNFRFGRRESVGAWLYANSLSLALFALFALTMAAHAGFGLLRQNEQLRLRHEPPVTLAAYLGSGDFWVTVFQTWEAEFFAIGLYIALSVFLRQERSPESKAVGASDAQTGDPQE